MKSYFVDACIVILLLVIIYFFGVAVKIWSDRRNALHIESNWWSAFWFIINIWKIANWTVTLDWMKRDTHLFKCKFIIMPKILLINIFLLHLLIFLLNSSTNWLFFTRSIMSIYHVDANVLFQFIIISGFKFKSFYLLVICVLIWIIHLFWIWNIILRKGLIHHLV